MSHQQSHSLYFLFGGVFEESISINNCTTDFESRIRVSTVNKENSPTLPRSPKTKSYFWKVLQRTWQGSPIFSLNYPITRERKRYFRNYWSEILSEKQLKWSAIKMPRLTRVKRSRRDQLHKTSFPIVVVSTKESNTLAFCCWSDGHQQQSGAVRSNKLILRSIC